MATLVGRGPELARLRALVDAAGRSETQVVLIAGEPGIGKTRLAQELALDAATGGFEVLWAGGGGPDGPAFWPWSQALRAHIDQLSPARLAAELGTEAAEIACVLPELGRRLPALSPMQDETGDHARFRIFDAVTRFLVAASATQPLAIVIDDLHDADPASRRLLEFVGREARRAPILIVTTLRPVGGSTDRRTLAPMVAELLRQPGASLIELAGLSPTEVGTLATEITGTTSAAATVEALHRRTAGNPFFVIELVRLLAERSRLDDPDLVVGTSIETPPSVRAVVLGRLAQVSDPCRELMAMASTLGPSFSLSLLGEVRAPADTDALDVMEEALAAGLVREEAGDPDRYRFAHALVHETVEASLSGERRRRLHRKAALAFEARLQAGDDDALREAALHWCYAGVGDPGRTAEYSLRAAAAAMGRQGYEEAAAHCERALAALAPVAAAGDDDSITATWRGPLLVQLGLARRAVGEAAVARHALRSAVEIARRGSDGPLLARAALALGGVWDPPTLVDDDLRRALDEAQELLGDADPPVRVELMARAARAREDVALANRAIADARRLDDHRPLLSALVARHCADDGIDADERARLTDEIVALAHEVGDLERRLQAEILLVRTHLERADRPAATGAMDRARRLAAELRSPHYAGLGALFDVTWAYVDGRFGDVERIVGSGAFTGPFLETFTAPIAQLYDIAVRRERGRLAELGPLLDVVAVFPNYPAVRFAVPAMYLGAGRDDDARRVLTDTSIDPSVPSWALALRAEACARLDEIDEAAALYPVLRRHTGRMAVVSNALLCLDPVDRSLGLLAVTIGRVADGIAHLEAAIGQSERFGARAAAARARADLGLVLLDRGRPPDRNRARQLLTDASAEAEELGMEALAVRLAGALERLETTPGGGRRSPALGPTPTTLTTREVEVLALIANGYANKQIAEALEVSETTAKTHVSNILGKIGVTDRTQAAIFAVRSGLVSVETQIASSELP
ncbi:MAG: helix-turn-helix transcriptional regulator [Acidimicrobiales bacterium]